MSHLIAGFPDAETSIAIADALVKGGANILEIQLAFSDPSADGPAIQGACTEVLKGFQQFTEFNQTEFVRTFNWQVQPVTILSLNFTRFL